MDTTVGSDKEKGLKMNKGEQVGSHVSETFEGV
jgi:hypothetical protein